MARGENIPNIPRIYCNIMAGGAIIGVMMIGAMARIEAMDNDGLVVQARCDSDALGQLYEKYYEPIFRYCVHRLFSRDAAEDVTSAVFLQVARQIRHFRGSSEKAFRCWLYAIAGNHANDHIRRTTRRTRLLEKAARYRAKLVGDCSDEKTDIDWPMLYGAILQLKPKHQTIVTLRFFEGLSFDEIAGIVKTKPGTVRVALKRALETLRRHLTSAFRQADRS